MLLILLRGEIQLALPYDAKAEDRGGKAGAMKDKLSVVIVFKSRPYAVQQSDISFLASRPPPRPPGPPPEDAV